MTSQDTQRTGALGRHLRRRTNDRVIGGVAGGLGDYFNVDPLLIRIGFVGLIIFGGAGLVLYLVAWLLVPAEGQDKLRRREGARSGRTHPGTRDRHRLHRRGAPPPDQLLEHGSRFPGRRRRAVGRGGHRDRLSADSPPRDRAGSGRGGHRRDDARTTARSGRAAPAFTSQLVRGRRPPHGNWPARDRQPGGRGRGGARPVLRGRADGDRYRPGGWRLVGPRPNPDPAGAPAPADGRDGQLHHRTARGRRRRSSLHARHACRAARRVPAAGRPADAGPDPAQPTR